MNRYVSAFLSFVAFAIPYFFLLKLYGLLLAFVIAWLIHLAVQRFGEGARWPVVNFFMGLAVILICVG